MSAIERRTREPALQSAGSVMPVGVFGTLRAAAGGRCDWRVRSVFECSPVPHLRDGDSEHFLMSLSAVGDPAAGFVQGPCPLVLRDDPQHRLAVPERV